MSIKITDAKILLGNRLLDGAISIRGRRIDKIGRATVLPKSKIKIKAKGLIAIPGLIDAHVHLRDMELAYKEDFSSGTLAAAAGGFTTVFDMPNTKPPTSSSERLREKTEKARTAINVNVGFYGTLVESAAELRRMVDAGAIAFKLYMNDPNPEAWHNDRRSLLSALKTCASLRTVVACHAENGRAAAKIQKRAEAAGRNSIQDFLKAHAPSFEIEATSAITDMSRRAHSRVHICHVSTQRALKAILFARRAGASVTCEATPHHLLLDEDALKRKGVLAIMVPPLRKVSDRRALWKALLGKRVDIIASDHAPHTRNEKAGNDAWLVRPGIPGLETTLSLMLTKVHRSEMTLTDLVDLLARNPATLLGLETKGQLVPGMDADIVLLDPKERFRIDSSSFYSKARFSPFDGFECVGRPVMTIVSGRVVYDRGEIAEKNCGRVITRRVRA